MAGRAKATIREHLVLDPAGKPVGVYLSLADYQKVRTLLEDAVDHRWFEKRKHEKPLPFTRVLHELKRKGIL